MDKPFEPVHAVLLFEIPNLFDVCLMFTGYQKWLEKAKNYE